MTHPARFLSAVLTLLGVACTGDIGAGGGDSVLPEVPGQRPSCLDGPTATDAPLLRLGRSEYERALASLVGEDGLGRAEVALAAMPEETAEEGEAFRRLDHRTGASHIAAYYGVADALAQAAAGNRDFRTSLMGSCGAAPDRACFEAFARSFVRRAYRRAPSREEEGSALALFEEFSDPNEAVHALVFTTLMAPAFLYRFENAGEVDGDEIVLTDYELASRLSFHFWGAPPDDALLDAAEQGELRNDGGYEAALSRLAGDARTDATILTFFDEWLHLERGAYADGPRLNTLRDDLDTSSLAAEMREEVEDLIRFHLDAGDGWDAVLTSEYSFARTETLASIYGVETWNGEGAGPRLPAGERSGILTRAGMLASTDGSTNPFRRGAFLRRSILCDRVDPPPNDLPPDALQPPPPEAGATTREVFAAKVVNEPCASCHASFSPLGYAMESYDGLGRYREQERLVSEEGEELGSAAVDAAVSPAIDRPGDAVSMSAVELSQRIAESPKANACFATQYARFTFRRHESGADFCAIEDLSERLENGASMREALIDIARTDAFRRRTLPSEEGEEG